MRSNPLTKISKHPRYDDPSAFRQRFARIEPTTGGTPMASMMGVKEQVYKWGRCAPRWSSRRKMRPATS